MSYSLSSSLIVVLLLFQYFLYTVQLEEKVSYEKNQLWNVKIDGSERTKWRTLAKLRDENDISIWGGNRSQIDILVRPESLDKVSTHLNNTSIPYVVMIDNLQRIIDEENPLEQLELDDRKGHKLTWKAYHRLEDIYGFLNYLNESYPSLCHLEEIGKSVENRPIYLLKIGTNAEGGSIWVDGGIHAREWISPATVTYLINYLVGSYEDLDNNLKTLNWYFVPVLNPDGYEYAHQKDRLWRKNRSGGVLCMGTDLNRNFGYKWGGAGSSKIQCRETYGGAGPFSEPETKAVQQYILRHNSSANWKAYLSFHSYGQYILSPWGYDRFVPPDWKDLQNVAHEMAKAIVSKGGPKYTVGAAANTLYPASGGSDDWAKGVAHIKYAYTIELRDGGRFGFVLPAHHIEPTAQDALSVIQTIAKWV